MGIRFRMRHTYKEPSPPSHRCFLCYALNSLTMANYVWHNFPKNIPDEPEIIYCLNFARAKKQQKKKCSIVSILTFCSTLWFDGLPLWWHNLIGVFFFFLSPSETFFLYAFSRNTGSAINEFACDFDFCTYFNAKFISSMLFLNTQKLLHWFVFMGRVSFTLIISVFQNSILATAKGLAFILILVHWLRNTIRLFCLQFIHPFVMHRRVHRHFRGSFIFSSFYLFFRYY